MVEKSEPFCGSGCQQGIVVGFGVECLAACVATPTRSWACGGGPRFHFVASRLRLPQRALGHPSAEWTVHTIQLDAGRLIHNGLGARNAAKVDLQSGRKCVAGLADEIVQVNQCVACQSTGIASMQATRKRRRNVKVALQAAPINEQPIHPWRTRFRHPCRDRHEQRIGQGGGAANVASMQRSEIEGRCIALMTVSAIHSMAVGAWSW